MITELEAAVADLARRVNDTDPDPVDAAVMRAFWAVKMAESYAHAGRSGDPAEPMADIITDVLCDMRHLLMLTPDGFAMSAGDNGENTDRAFRAGAAAENVYGHLMPDDFDIREVFAHVVMDMRDLCAELKIDFDEIDDRAEGHFAAEHAA